MALDFLDTRKEVNSTASFLSNKQSGTILSTNIAACQFYGYSKEEFLGKNYSDLVICPDSLSEDDLKLYKRYLLFGSHIELHRHKNGNPQFVQVETEEISIDPLKKKVFLHQTYPLKEIRNIETDFRFHLDKSPFAYIEYDRNFKLTSVSDKFTSWFGYEKNEILGCHIKEIIELILEPCEQAKALQQIAEVEKGALNKSTIKTRAFNKIGESVSLTIHNSVHHDRQGRLISAISLVENNSITNEKTQKLKLTAQGDNIVFWSYNLQNRQPEYSKQWIYRKLGYTEVDFPFSKETWKTLIHPHDFNRMTEQYAKHEAGELGGFEAEFRMKTKSSQWRWFLNRAKITEYDLEGDPLKLTGILIDIDKYKKKENKIRDLFEEKNVLLQEVHHRVKNNLAVIYALLNLQKMTLDNEEARLLLTDSEMRIKTMALIHERLYATSSFSKVDISGYLKDSVSYIKKLYDPEKKVEIDVNCDEVSLSINEAIPWALILNELLTNAFKSAFDNIENKRLMIDVFEIEGKVSCIVRDNGIGLREDFNYKQPETMGYTIIQTLIKQLHGDLSISAIKGTAVHFCFERKSMRGIGTNN